MVRRLCLSPPAMCTHRHVSRPFCGFSLTAVSRLCLMASFANSYVKTIDGIRTCQDTIDAMLAKEGPEGQAVIKGFLEDTQERLHKDTQDLMSQIIVAL